MLDAIASEDKVVKYVDIPLQHASEPVLKRMKRPTGKGNLLGMVERIRERVPGVAVRTSFIVGFPGETDEDFAKLVEFVEAGRFDNVGVFTFSDEEGTTSWDLPGRVPARVKESRKRKLMSLQKKLSLRRNRARVGERVEVLVEGTHPDSDLLLRGRLATQAPEIDGQVIVNDGTAEPGSFVTCEVTEAHHYDLVGRIVLRPPTAEQRASRRNSQEMGRPRGPAPWALPDQPGAELHLARIAEAALHRAVEVEDQVRDLRDEQVRRVEQVEDVDDRLERDAPAERELASRSAGRATSTRCPCGRGCAATTEPSGRMRSERGRPKRRSARRVAPLALRRERLAPSGTSSAR